MLLLAGSTFASAVLFWRAVRTRWQDRISVAAAISCAYLAFSTFFFWQFWLLDGISVPKGGGDLVSFLFPTYRFAADALQSGQFPFWNPHLYGGTPFGADLQSGLYYPPNLIAFALVRPFTYDALQILAVLHYPLASLSAYVLARELGTPRLGAFAAGLVFGFSGFTVAHLGHYNMLAAASWVPLSLAALLRAHCAVSIRWAVVGGGAFGLVLLPGHTQTALYTALALFAVWLTLIWRRRTLGKHLFTLPALLAVGLATAAVQLLPAFELARLSIRSEISYQRAAEFAASPLGLVTFVIPHFFGDSPVDYWGLPSSLQESYGYVGVSGLVLAGLALVLARREPRWLAVGALGLFWLLVAFGESTPLQGWLYRLVPGFDKVRAPGRALMFVDLALALLAGWTVGRLGGPLRWRDRPLVRRFTLGLAVSVAVGLLVAAPLFHFALLTSQNGDPAILRRVSAAATSLNLSLIFAAVLLAVLWRWRRGARGWPAPILVGLLALDLTSANATFNPTTSDLLAGYRHESTVDWLRQNVGDGRVDTRTGIADVWQPNLAMIAGLDEVSGLFNPLTLRALDRYWGALGSRAAPGYDLLAVRFVVARRDAPLDEKFRLAFTGDHGLAVFENTQALPRAFVAPRAERLSAKEIERRLRDPSFEPDRVALLEDGEVVAGGDGRVDELVRHSPNEMTVSLIESQGGHLVVSEVWYPGWSAQVDGVDAPVLRAYNLLMAVPLPVGAREVRLGFHPRFWIPGLLITLAAWGVVVAAGLATLPRAWPVGAGAPRASTRAAWP